MLNRYFRNTVKHPIVAKRVALLRRVSAAFLCVYKCCQYASVTTPLFAALEYSIALPLLDELLTHRRCHRNAPVSPYILLSVVERSTVRVRCLAKEHCETQRTREVLDPERAIS